MSIALLTTLYGLIISNWLIIPCSENLQFKAKQNFHLNRIIAYGLELIQEDKDALYVEESLKAFVDKYEK